MTQLHSRRKLKQSATCIKQPIRCITQGIHLISTDEMTAIQALERAHSTLPMRPGKVELQEFEYIRHGTQSLIANLEVATGQVIAPSLGATRTLCRFCNSH